MTPPSIPATSSALARAAATATVPDHVAIIPDGNRRFARARGWDAERAYRAGAEKMLEVVGWCLRRGVRRLSGFGLSRENVHHRPADEVSAVLRALAFFAGETGRRYGLAPHLLGDLTGLARYPEAAALAPLMAPPRPGARMTIQVVVNFSPEHNLRALAAAIPRIDLVIRSGGHRRLSGFLPFACAYAELWFCDRLWPAFTEGDLDTALAWYGTQERTSGE